MTDVGQKSRTTSGPWARLCAAALAAVVLFGCRDYLVEPGGTPYIAKPSCVSPDPPHPTKCGPPPPAEHHLPAVEGDMPIAPLRLDATREGWLLTSDPTAAMILRIDPISGRPFEGLKTRGKPLGVTLLEDAIYVGNADRRTIDVHRTDGGGFMASFGESAVLHPADLAADVEEDLIFALDGLRREVRVFSQWGSLVRTISGPGAGEDQLVNPTALGLDPVRKWVLVSDYGSADGGPASLKIFDYDGGFVHEISGRGRCGSLGCSGGFSRPQSAGVDAVGLIYLPDALLGEVLVYDPADWSRHDPIGEWGFLRVPTAVAIDGFGDLFIASSRTGDVHVLSGVTGS